MPGVDGPRSGQPCPQPDCDGVLRVETTRIDSQYRRRYLKCNRCAKAPENNIELIPLRYAPPQPPRRAYSRVVPTHVGTDPLIEPLPQSE